MSLLGAFEECDQPPTWQSQLGNPRDLKVQLALSIVFGFSAFLTFCVSRP